MMPEYNYQKPDLVRRVRFFYPPHLTHSRVREEENPWESFTFSVSYVNKQLSPLGIRNLNNNKKKIKPRANLLLAIFDGGYLATLENIFATLENLHSISLTSTSFLRNIKTQLFVFFLLLGKQRPS